MQMLGRENLIWIVGEGRRPIWSPHIQLDLDEMRAESRRLRTPGGRDSPSRQRQAAFTKVPKFSGVTSWEQYRL